jgi:hypothetical protein
VVGNGALSQNVHDPSYSDSWVEGMVVVHNPKALIKLPPEMVPGACYEFLQPDGRIMSLLPEFHPIFSLTQIRVAGKRADDRQGSPR